MMITPLLQLSSDSPSKRKAGVHAKAGGFTLIELLVVIAIIALLAALVFSVLGGVSERANRTTCVSNLRQVFTAIGRFAGDNDGAIPVGYRAGKKQFNTTLYSGSSDKWVLLGHLVRAGLIQDPKILFCPSEKDRTQAFATVENPWPFEPGKNVQSAFATTPVVDWGSEENPPEWPRLSQLGRVALLADGAGMPKRVDSRHKDGVNVVFSDGSARWVPREEFNKQLSSSASLDAGANDAQTAIWEIYSGIRAPDSEQD